jgi:hypothetical protein
LMLVVALVHKRPHAMPFATHSDIAGNNQHLIA